MSKNSVQQFSTTAASNTDIAGINVNTGWPPGNVGSATRTLMSLLASLAIPTPVSLGSTAVTLTAAQASQLFLPFTGTPGGTCTVTLPNQLMQGFVQNASGSSVILTTGAGTTLTIPNDSLWDSYAVDGSGNVTQLAIGVPRAAAASGSPLRADQAWQLISTNAVSSVSTLVLALPSSFAMFRLQLLGMITSVDVTAIAAQISLDGGATYKNTQYNNAATSLNYNNAAGTSAAANTAAGLLLSPSLSSNGAGYSTTLDFYPGDVTKICSVYGRGYGFVGGSVYMLFNVGAAWGGGTGRATHINIFPNAGTMSGTVILEGLP